MSVLTMKIMRGCSSPLYLILACCLTGDHTVPICMYTHRLCSDAEFMCNVWQRYDALASDGDTGSASSARVFTVLIFPLKHLVTSRSCLLGISAQMHGICVLASGSQPHLHSHHDLDTVAEMVMTAASAMVLNVVGMIGPDWH